MSETVQTAFQLDDNGDPVARVGLPPVDLALQEFDNIIEPISRRHKWSTSRLCLTAGKIPIPVLTFLAKLKFGDYDNKLWAAYWKDANYENETFENVGLVSRATGDQRRNNPYGVPAGTKEYWRAYRKANKDRIRAYHKKSSEKVKTALAALAQIEGKNDELVIEKLLGGGVDVQDGSEKGRKS